MEIGSNTNPALVKRDLDGMYIRVNVGGKWQNRCLTDLDWRDVELWLDGRFKAVEREDVEKMAKQAIKHLHERLRHLGDALDLARPSED